MKELRIQDYLKPSFLAQQEDASNPFAQAAVAVKKAPKPADIKVKVSGGDFLVTKTTKASKKTLVCLPGQDLFFVRDEKLNLDIPLTVEGFQSFIGKTDEIPLTDDETGEQCCWLEALRKGKAFAEGLFRIFSDVKPLLPRGEVFFTADMVQPTLWPYGPEGIRYIRALFRVIPEAEKMAAASAAAGQISSRNRYHRGIQETNLYSKYSSIFAWFIDDDDIKVLDTSEGWGLSGTIEFLKEFIISPVGCLCHIRNMLALLYRDYNRGYGRYGRPVEFNGVLRTNLSRGKLTEYILYQACEEGCEDSNDKFVMSFVDYLRMKEDLARVGAGRDFELYPKNLFTEECKLSSVHRRYTQEMEKIDDAEWAEYVKFLAQYEYSGPVYSVIAPKEKADMLDEARQQHNCLSSYISRVKDGECMIFFLRKNDRPEKSFVSIQVMSDGTLGQVLAACNKRPPADAEIFVNEWHRKMFAQAQTA